VRRIALVPALVVLAAASVSVLVSGEEPEPPAPPPPPRSFPATFEGVWKGPCVNRMRGGRELRFPMELHVAPVESPGKGKGEWTWTIVYGEGERRQVRPYVLRPVDAKAGHWVVDERNGILIDAFVSGNALHSRFSVMGNVIDVTYRLRDGGFDVLLTTYGDTAARTSGGEGRIPEVEAFALKSVQSGRLTRAEAR
jgi:hypothetical protein